MEALPSVIGKVRICGSFLVGVIVVAGGGGIIISDDDIQRVQQPFSSLAVDAFGIDCEIIPQVQHIAGGFDLAPVHIAFGNKIGVIVDDGLLADDFDAAGALAIFHAGGIQGTAHFHLAVIAPIQEDLPFFIFPQGFGFDGTAVVHHSPQQILGTFGGHHHIAPVGLDPASVQGLGLDQFPIHGIIQLPVAVRRQGP